MIRLRTQKLLARGLFLFLGILPLLATVTWASLRNWQESADKLCDRWSRQLGLNVQLDSVGHPFPGVMRLDGLRAVDPESGQPVLLGSSVTIFHKNRTTRLDCRELTLQASHLPELWELLFERILRQPGVWGNSIDIIAPELKLLGAACKSPLLQARLQVESLSAGREANLRIDWQKGLAPSTARILRRRQQKEQGKVSVRIETGPQSVPCQFFPWPLDWLRKFGANAAFQGLVWIDNVPLQPRVELTGHVTKVDLQESLGQFLTVDTSGYVDLLVHTLLFENGRIRQLDAQVRGGPITMERELVTNFANEVGASLDIFNDSGKTFRFDVVHFGLRLDDGGLYLQETADERETTKFLAGSDAKLSVPYNQPVATTALIKAIVPDSSLMLPINSTSELLIRKLPLGD